MEPVGATTLPSRKRFKMEPVGATTLPSRKRFLTNPNPYQASTSVSPESSLSSDSSSDRLAKKTRELPNLSDCHGCGYRINYSNPKERLQPLESVWRIVLLCRKCTNRVKSSDLCPYCFSATAGLDCFKCRECQRRIHKDCVGKYGGIAPWSYCCSGLGFDVCIDCWVPNSLANSIRLYKRNSRKKVNVSLVTLPKPDFRVLMGGSYGTKMPKKVAEDANIFMERKVADAVKEKKIALQKAVVAKSAVELANGALNLVASNEPVSRVLVGFSNGTKSPKEVAKDAYIFMERKVSDAVKAKEIANCVVELANGALNLVAGNENGKHISVRDYFVSKAVNDAELAFLFHRAMNSSALISRSKCLVDSSSLAVPEVLHASESASTNACSELEVYGTNSKLSEKINKTVSEVSICFKTSHCGPFIDLSNGEVFGANISSDDNECQGHCERRCNAKADRYLLKYHRTDKNVTKPSALCKFSDSDSCADLVSSIFGAVTDTRACLNCNELQLARKWKREM